MKIGNAMPLTQVLVSISEGGRFHFLKRFISISSKVLILSNVEA